MVSQSDGSLETSISAFDFGARFGTGYELPIKTDLSLWVGINYDMGLSNIDVNGSGTSQTRSLMTNLGLGVKL